MLLFGEQKIKGLRVNIEKIFQVLQPVPHSELPVETYFVLRSPFFQARSVSHGQAFLKACSLSCVICSLLMNVFMDLKCLPLAVGPFMHAKLPCVLTGGTH